MLDIYTKDDSESFRPFAIKKKIIPLSLCHLYIRARDVLFEYHRAVVPFGWAVRPVRSLSTL